MTEKRRTEATFLVIVSVGFLFGFGFIFAIFYLIYIWLKKRSSTSPRANV